MNKLILLSLIAISAPAMAATNLVANGDFESGNFSGWSQFGDTGFTGVDTGLPSSGSFAAYFGPVNAFGGISQTLATGSHAYTLSFDLANSGGSANYVNFNGTTVLSNVADQGTSYTSYSFTVNATGPSTLEFGFLNPPDYYYLDNVSVTQFGGAVPEPAAWALLIAGFGLTGAAMRRRRHIALAA